MNHPLRIKWRTEGYSSWIIPVECTNETTEYVWIVCQWSFGVQVTKAKKASDYTAYHDTWEAAHAYLTEKAERRIAAARRSLQEALDFAGDVKGLRKPEETT